MSSPTHNAHRCTHIHTTHNTHTLLISFAAPLKYEEIIEDYQVFEEGTYKETNTNKKDIGTQRKQK